MTTKRPAPKAAAGDNPSSTNGSTGFRSMLKTPMIVTSTNGASTIARNTLELSPIAFAPNTLSTPSSTIMANRTSQASHGLPVSGFKKSNTPKLAANVVNSTG